MKKPGVNTLISYVNGLPNGDFAIPANANGDKFKTNTDFSMITIGKLHGYFTTNFTFKCKKWGSQSVKHKYIFSISQASPLFTDTEINYNILIMGRLQGLL